MPQPATRESWKTLPLPSQRETFELAAVFSEAEGERMRMGHIPEEMEDKWFVFFEQDWLYFLRSWTGICIYALRLEATPDGARVTEGWANREDGQTLSNSIVADKRMVQELIESRLLSDYGADDDFSDSA